VGIGRLFANGRNLWNAVPFSQPHLSAHSSYTKDGGPLGIWRQWAPRAQRQAMNGGHFFPEENPDHTAALINQLLAL
jgi:hypothetical protein